MKSRLVNHLSVAMAITLSHFAIDSIKNYAFAQISSDSTLSTPTRVETTDFLNFVIENGDRIGDNLFHSFLEFSVPTDGSAFFDNANDIANIFSRVTGGSISDIDGLIRANGAANLFLLNPAGIVFGPNASLNIGGSFLATTADSFVFADGVEFSATNPQAPPLLEVNIPIGLRFRDNPGDIAVNNSNLAVNQGQNLSLIGGNVTLIGGNVALQSSNLSAPGGRIEIGGLAVAGTVDLNPDFSFVFPESLAQGDVSLTELATVSVVSNGGGEISINVQNLSITGGSSLNAGIIADADTNNAQAGDIVVNVIDTFLLDGTDENGDINSGFFNDVNRRASGVSGNITVNANTLNLSNNARIQSDIANNTLRNPNNRSGDININANEVNISNDVAIFNRVGNGRQGQSGDINIQTGSLNLLDSDIRTVVRNGAEGNSGDININADSILLESSVPGNENILIQTRIAGNEAMGDAGNININADSFELVGGVVESRIANGSQGNAGDININANSLDLINGSIKTELGDNSQGSSGNINLEVENITLLDNALIESSILGGVEGNAGSININTGNLYLEGINARIRSGVDSSSSNRVVNQGTGGDILIKAETIQLLNGASFRLPVQREGDGTAGNLTIFTNSLELINGGRIAARTNDIGNAGNIEINATDYILISGVNPGVRSGFDVNGEPEMTIITSRIGTDTVDTNDGQAGQIIINTGTLQVLDGGLITASTGSSSSGGNITVTAENLELNSGGQILSNTLGEGDAGNIKLNISESITIEGTDPNRNSLIQLVQESVQQGIESGELPLDTDIELAIEEAFFTVGSQSGVFASGDAEATGDAGSINIDPINVIIRDGGEISVSNLGTGQGGTIDLTTDNLELDNGQITATTSGSAIGGNINLNVSDLLLLRNRSEISAANINQDSVALEGNIDINTNLLVLLEGSSIITSDFAPDGGSNIGISAAGIFVSTDSIINATGDLTIDTDIELESTELPEVKVVDDGDQVSQNACYQGQGSQFANTGRGGVPTNVTESLNSDTVRVDLVEPVASSTSNASIDPSLPLDDEGKPIIPAQGWIFTEDGKVLLTAYNPDEVQRSASIKDNCVGR